MQGNHCQAAPRRLSLHQVQMMMGDMKRDDELLRELMLALEADPEPVVLHDSHLKDTAEDVRTYYHLRLLVDAGFLEESGKFGGSFRITNAGHDFIAMMHDEGLWARMKAKALDVTPRYTLQLLFEVGNALLRQKAREIGIPLE